jgi:predicted MPP superfamily phosphohydrolase
MTITPLSRRDFLKFGGYTFLAGLLTASGGLGYATQIEPAWLEIVRLRLKLPRLAAEFSGLRLAQISDIHMGGWMNAEHFAQVVEAVLAEAPDVIALTGDYLLGYGWDETHQQALEALAPMLKTLADSTLTLAVMGNHDHWSDVQKIRAMLANVGILELANSVFTLQQGAARLHIGGVDDVYEGQDRLQDVLHQLPAQGAAILLCHEPDFADTAAASARFDLQISGHSHGGQVVVPFFGPLHTPKFAEKYPLGLYQVAGMFQYTNRGVGMARLPIRFNCRPEVTIFTLEAENL